jgi:hemoglobin/transferrin/lactoferrin receptor protein
MPSWITLNLRGNVQVAKKLQFQFGVENIFDRNYRYFASGFSAPGRSFIIALRSNF